MPVPPGEKWLVTALAGYVVAANGDRGKRNAMESLRKFVDVLRYTEWLSADRITEYQRKPLEKLIRHAYQTVPFYKDRLAVLFRRDGSIDWERWTEVPFLTRTEIQDRKDDLLSGAIPKSHGELDIATSSGSTGQPIMIKKTALTHIAYYAVRARYHDWHKIDRNLKYASIRHAGAGDARYPEGQHNDVWAVYGSYMGLNCRGPEAVLNVNTPIDQQADWLVREQPDYLHTFPTNAAALAEFFANEPPIGQSLQLRTILTLSETVTDDTRRRCRETFGTEIVDNYNSVECGYFAIQCPERTHYHVQSEVILLEILDQEDRPCSPGEMGRVVVTPFYNYAMPLIRYETADLAVVGGKCSCGRNSPVLARIVGRSRNLFRFPNNSLVVPELTGGPFAKYLRPRRWQVAQTGPLELEVRLVPEDKKEEMDFEGMTDYIRRLLRPDLSVNYRYVDEFPSTPGGKHEVYICELPEPS